MEKIQSFQITGMTIAGFKSYQEPTSMAFGSPTVITGGNGRGKTSIADAIAFAVTGLPFFGERGIDRLHNEAQPDVSITMNFVDETGCAHVLTRTRRKNTMTILYDGCAIRQMDLTELFGEKDVFLSIFNPLYFIEELGDEGKNLLERHLPMIPHETVLAQLSKATRKALEGENILSPENYLKKKREDIRNLEETIIYLQGQKDLSQTQDENWSKTVDGLSARHDVLSRNLAELEAKRFDGLDQAAMGQQLVELSARYNEAAQDDSPLDAEILELEAYFYRKAWAGELAVSFFWRDERRIKYNEDGSEDNEYGSEHVLLPYDDLYAFIREQSWSGAPSEWKCLALEESKQSRLVFVEKRNLRKCLSNKLIRKKLVRFLRDRFCDPDVPQVNFYDRAVPYSFTFEDICDTAFRTVGAVTLLHADDLEKARFCFTSRKEPNPRSMDIFSHFIRT